MDIKRFYVDIVDINNGNITIKGDEFNHLTRVLRYKVGFKLIACNNHDGFDYLSTIVKINRDNAECKVNDIIKNECLTSTAVTLYQALPKGDKIDLIVQKSIELGTSEIVVFESDNIAETKFNLDRLNRINIEACKQCGRSRVASIRGLLSFSDMINELQRFDKIIVCYEHEKLNTFRRELLVKDIKNLAIIVGSEGGFSMDEITKITSAGGKSVTLGKRILRCETASIVSVGIAMYELGEMER